MTTILKNRYDVITLPPIVRFWRNFAGRRKITRWWLYISQNRNRKQYCGVKKTKTWSVTPTTNLGRFW